MIRASLYILACTARNRLRVRLRRLREPRYLVGALVGAAYLYFTFFARMHGARAGARRGGGQGAQEVTAFLAAHHGAVLGFAGLALLVLACLAWLLPVESGLLEFSQAEVALLFPAPVSRRQLLVHRLIRSQLGLLFGGAIAALVFPATSTLARLQAGVTVWLVLVTAKVYFTGVSLARGRLFREREARPLAWAPVVFLLAVLAIVAAAVTRALDTTAVLGPGAILGRIGGATASGASRLALWPFSALVRPALAASPVAFVAALAGAGLVLAAVTAWVLRSGEAFQDAAVATAERQARKGGSRPAASSQRLRAWSLAPGGRPEGALFWKGATQAVRAGDRRTLLRIAAVVAAFTAGAVAVGYARGLAAVVGAFATIGAVVAILLGPQILRTDLRQDLLHLEVLRTWPVRPSAVVRGEMAWPAALLTGAAWALTLLALYLSAPVFGAQSTALRVALAAAAAALAPGLIAAQLAIQNAAVLMFPAWVPLGTARPRGLDAMGQRLIMLAGVMLLLVIGVAPGAVAGGIVWFALHRLVGSAAIPAGALVCSGVVLLEVLLATEAMGPLYDRIDLVEVERAEA